jgi:hypothetical protein
LGAQVHQEGWVSDRVELQHIAVFTGLDVEELRFGLSSDCWSLLNSLSLSNHELKLVDHSEQYLPNPRIQHDAWYTLGITL